MRGTTASSTRKASLWMSILKIVIKVILRKIRVELVLKSSIELIVGRTLSRVGKSDYASWRTCCSGSVYRVHAKPCECPPIRDSGLQSSFLLVFDRCQLAPWRTRFVASRQVPDHLVCTEANCRWLGHARTPPCLGQSQMVVWSLSKGCETWSLFR